MSLLLKKINGGLRMFKKIVLTVLLIMLLSSAVYAEITIDTPPITIVKSDEEAGSISNSNEFWVWLEVPEQLPPPPEKTFLVDLYISTFGGYLGDFTIKLVPDSKKIRFTNALLNPPFPPYLYSDTLTSSYDTIDNSATISVKNVDSLLSVGGRKLFLRRLWMEVIEPGYFKISLDKDASVAFKDISKSTTYVLKQGNTRVVRNTLCVPKSTPCSNNCGNVDNGCGKIVSCSNTCASGQVCSTNNVCVDALGSVLPNAPSYDKTLLEKITTALGYSGKEGKFAGIVNAIVNWFKDTSNN